MATGAVAAEYDYDSFGQRTLVQGVEEVRYGFTSREHDALTGLIHYRARAYDPLTGQFLQRDPIGFLDVGSPARMAHMPGHLAADCLP